MKSTEDILFEINLPLDERSIPEDIDTSELDEILDEANGFPSKQEMEKIREENEKNQELQNQTHDDQCGNCIKAANNSGNIKAVMRYCQYNGLMVSKFQAICGKFAPKKPASGLG